MKNWKEYQQSISIQTNEKGQNLSFYLVEKTPGYLLVPSATELLGTYTKYFSSIHLQSEQHAHLKIFVILRNPVYRLWSDIWMSCLHHNSQSSSTLSSKLRSPLIIKQKVSNLTTNHSDLYPCLIHVINIIEEHIQGVTNQSSNLVGQSNIYNDNTEMVTTKYSKHQPYWKELAVLYQVIKFNNDNSNMTFGFILFCD
ncbi:hypothetical protein RFI_19685 [Reticulomyxa filosa]|uniref:Sulfotransferase n=1 Tax=Reticulomyxa filosa TaxID=46433 RepID=X6MUG8_RETFI|nr:hypothetical protein RFI_19685 [Reticulomyxa filosa]|eukprot:ETO17633.1 hypothetical protein RFI_19685 [Reticulomyxa filosa]